MLIRYYRIVNFVLGILLLVSCESATAVALPITPTPPIQTNTPTPITPLLQRVTFQTEDDVQIAGTLYGNGENAVILAHQGTVGADQYSWSQFATMLAENNFTALAFDFRGVGRSGGELDYSQLDKDVRAAVRYLQSQEYHQIVCVGASMGGTACLRAAIDGEPFLGLITLASTMALRYRSLVILPEELGNLTQPKLFITAENDINLVVQNTRSMYRLSPEPKKLLLLKGYEHGTDLFRTSVGDELREAILDFLEEVFAN